MDLSLLQRQSNIEWVIAPFGKMRVPAILYASKSLIHDIDPRSMRMSTSSTAKPGACSCIARGLYGPSALDTPTFPPRCAQSANRC